MLRRAIAEFRRCPRNITDSKQCGVESTGTPPLVTLRGWMTDMHRTAITVSVPIIRAIAEYGWVAADYTILAATLFPGGPKRVND